MPRRQAAQKITNSAQKPIFCALFYSQGSPIPSPDAGFYSRRSTFHFTNPAPLYPSTKTPILCSKCPKTWVSKAKSAQEPRFCARNARKQGFQSQKAHKNLDFVLENPKNGASEGQKRTKTSILCSGRRGLAVGREDIGIGKSNRGLPANHRARFQNANAS